MSRTCALCPKLCRSECPVSLAEGSETVTPTGLLSTVYLAELEQRPLSEDEAELMWHCSGCRGCESLCELDQQPADLLREARAQAWSQGTAPAAARERAEQIRTDTNPFGPDQAKHLKKVAEKRCFERRGRVLFWPGCACVDAQAGELSRLFALFTRLGADHISLPARRQLPCCGAHLSALGDEEGFRAQAEAMEQWFNRQRSIVSASPECLEVIDRRYAEVGVEIRAERFHLAEWLLLFREPLAELLGGARAAWEERGGVPRVVWHDPCQLARGRGQTDAPREILRLALGRDPEELTFHRERSRCCGGSVSFDTLYPETARDMAQSVLADEQALACDWLVSGSPACARHLARSSRQGEVMDLISFLTRFTAPVLE